MGLFTALVVVMTVATQAFETSPSTFKTPPTANGTWATIQEMQQIYKESTASLLNGSNCSTSSVRVRKSWSALTRLERLEYLEAVQCLYKNPAITDRKNVPGIRNRRDDFTYWHSNRTNFIHVSGTFLPWHRYFVWQYEEALRNECGYNGSQPYWDWAEFSDDQMKSPVFDGSETSFGSNGASIPHDRQSCPIPGLPVDSNGKSLASISREPGTGGGCISDGYFKDMIISLGPVCPANETQRTSFGIGYNPRCISRDINNQISQEKLNSSNVLSLLQSPDISLFRPAFDQAMHPGAHELGGGDLYDFFTSPNDPVFYLLHSQVDRLWAIWQGQDYASRMNALSGTQTIFNIPPSENATLDTVLEMGLLGEDKKIGEFMSTVGGGLCYVYE